jgi:hypothetical protein
MTCVLLATASVPAAEPGAIEWHTTDQWKGLGPICFRLAELPGQSFMLVFPEWITAREMNWHVDTKWTTSANAAEGNWREGDYSLTLRLKFAKQDAGSTLHWEYDFKNGSQSKLTDVAAFNCFNLVAAPNFKDLTLVRSWVGATDADKTWLVTVPKTKGPRTLQFYPAQGGIELVGFPRYEQYQATASKRLSGDRVGVVSRDGRWRVENLVDGPVAYFFNNWEPDHGCIHAAPLFGEVAAGKTATAKGRVVFIRQSGS